MDKRGTIRQYLWIFYLFLSAGILFLFLFWVGDSVDGTGYAREYLAINSGLLATSVYGGSGNLSVEYDPGDDYTVVFKDNLVQVRDPDRLDTRNYYYVSDDFYSDLDTSIEGGRENGKEFYFIKSEEGVQFG